MSSGSCNCSVQDSTVNNIDVVSIAIINVSQSNKIKNLLLGVEGCS